MKKWFEFNGQNSLDYGIVLAKTPPIVYPGIRYKANQYDGIDGEDYEELGYSAYDKPLTIGFTDLTRLQNISNWLRGSGKLTVWNESELYYDARIYDGINYERVLRFGNAQINVRVQPFKYMRDEQPTEALRVINQGNVNALPIIKITGSGVITLSINGTQVCTLTLTDYITLDSQAQDALHGVNYANNLMSGEFPVFKPGLNTITYTGNVTKIETTVRSRWV